MTSIFRIVVEDLAEKTRTIKYQTLSRVLADAWVEAFNECGNPHLLRASIEVYRAKLTRVSVRFDQPSPGRSPRKSRKLRRNGAQE